MFCMGSFAVCCFSDNQTIQKRKTKNGNNTGFVFIKTDQQNISQQGGLDRLVDVETVD